MSSMDKISFSPTDNILSLLETRNHSSRNELMLLIKYQQSMKETIAKGIIKENASFFFLFAFISLSVFLFSI